VEYPIDMFSWSWMTIIIVAILAIGSLVLGANLYYEVQSNSTTLVRVEVEGPTKYITEYIDRNITKVINTTIFINNTCADKCNNTYILKLIQQIKRMESRALRYRNCTDQGYDFGKINESLVECREELCELNRTSCWVGT